MRVDELYLMNPWWRDPEEIYVDKHIVTFEKSTFKYYPEKLFKEILPERPGVYTIRGPRQIGKTTFLKFYIKGLIEKGVNPSNIFFFTCDGINDRFELIEALKIYFQIFKRNLDEIRYLFIDEVTTIEDWQKSIKYLVDIGLLDNCLIVLRTNPTDPTASPREGADGVALFQQETYLMRTGEFAGLLPVKEGENVLTVTSWDNGFLIDKIILERSDFSAALISSDWPPRGSDADVIYRLENEFGMKVNFTEDEVIANSDPPVRAVYTPEALNAANIRLLVISATIDSGNVADHYLDADIPILFMEQAIFDDMLMGDSGANFDNDLREWSIVDNTHPITEGLPQDSVAVQFSEKDMLPGEMAYVTDTGAEGVSVLATSPDDPAQVTLAAIDEGGLLSDGSPAPNRRVFMGFADWNFGSDVANETTWEIFDAAVTWLLGGEEVPVEDWSLY